MQEYQESSSPSSSSSSNSNLEAETPPINYDREKMIVFLRNEAFYECFTEFSKELGADFLLNPQEPFLAIYLEQCLYYDYLWVRGMFFLLKMPLARKMIRQFCKNRYSPFANLFYAFNDTGVRKADRVRIIRMFLDLGASVNLHDLNACIWFYRFTEETKTVFKVLNDWKILSITTDLLKTDFSAGLSQMTTIMEDVEKMKDTIIKALRFSSIPPQVKPQLVERLKATVLLEHVEIFERIEALPAVPKLMELSREQVRETLGDIYCYRDLEDFEYILEGLGIPWLLRDILLFRIPLYDKY